MNNISNALKDIKETGNIIESITKDGRSISFGLFMIVLSLVIGTIALIDL